MYRRSYTGRFWQYYILGDFLLDVSGTYGYGTVDIERYKVSECSCRPIAAALDVPNGNEIDNRTTLRVTRLELCWSVPRNMIPVKVLVA